LIGANADLNKCDLDGRSPCFHAAVSTVRVRVGIIGRPIGPRSGLAGIPAWCRTGKKGWLHDSPARGGADRRVWLVWRCWWALRVARWVHAALQPLGKRAFPPFAQPVLTEICLWQACSAVNNELRGWNVCANAWDSA
jgi:hypothetical protein